MKSDFKVGVDEEGKEFNLVSKDCSGCGDTIIYLFMEERIPSLDGSRSEDKNVKVISFSIQN